MYEIFIPPLIDVFLNVWVGKPKKNQIQWVFDGDTWDVESDAYGLVI